MAQDLQDLLDECRGLMNDQDADLITDREFIKWINEGLVHMCNKGQLLEDVFQFNTVADKHEYPLTVDSGDIANVWFFTGSRQHELEERKMAKCMEGSRQSSSILTHYYKRLHTHATTSQDSTGAITRNVTGSRARDRKPRYVLGLFPTPSDVFTITVRMIIPHPRLRKSRDQILIPFEFHFGPVAYALFKAYSKEKAYAEARHYAEVWNDMLDQCRDWSIAQARVGHGEVVRDADCDTSDYPWRVIID